MRKFKIGLITLAASAAMLVPANSALAASSTATAATASTAALTENCLVVSCFDLYVNDVLSNNDVNVLVAAPFCGVQVSVLTVLGVGNWMDCGGGKKVHKKS